jgi:hypothetical protein
LIARFTRPRTRAGISSSMAELMAAYADAGEKAEEGEAGEPGREPAGHGGAHVDRQRDEEQALAPQAIGEAAEHECADDGAGDVQRPGPADLRGAEPQGVWPLEHAADGADDRDLEAV